MSPPRERLISAPNSVSHYQTSSVSPVLLSNSTYHSSHTTSHTPSHDYTPRDIHLYPVSIYPPPLVLPSLKPPVIMMTTSYPKILTTQTQSYGRVHQVSKTPPCSAEQKESSVKMPSVPPVRPHLTPPQPVCYASLYLYPCLCADLPFQLFIFVNLLLFLLLISSLFLIKSVLLDVFHRLHQFHTLLLHHLTHKRIIRRLSAVCPFSTILLLHPIHRTTIYRL